jgi:uncharacterized membrane protein YjjP (DUF1212 family)
MLESLNEYPRWFVLACAFMVAGGILWLLVKLLKLALWMFFFALTVAAIVTLVGYFLK